ncbi:hypothetical protein ACOBQX_05940 [Actinokineospora sp. G85]
MWIALATPLVVMIGAVGMAWLEPVVLSPLTSTVDDRHRPAKITRSG